MEGRSLLPSLVLSVEGFVLVVLAALMVTQFFMQRDLQQQVALLAEESTTLSEDFAAFQIEYNQQVSVDTDTQSQLIDQFLSQQKLVAELADELHDFDRDVGRLSGSVETLEKLTTTDPELLQKYSKIFFLNEHYLPSDLVLIDEKYDLVNGKEVSVHAQVWPFLKDLLEEAEDDGLDLQVLSGYRSFSEQATLKGAYLTSYGAGANTFSADQGYSEHQLGTTVDFTNTTLGENIDDFEQTEEFTWLARNAYKYGFVMSYPKNNEYYVYEPWHWRFVGTDLARYLDRQEKSFYDLEQRKIDEYVAELFD